MAKKLICDILIKGYITQQVEQDGEIYKYLPYPTVCTNNGITISIIPSGPGDTYDGVTALNYDGCEAKINFKVFPSSRDYSVRLRLPASEINFPPEADKNNVRLRLYAHLKSYGGNSETRSCAGYFPYLVYVRGGGGVFLQFHLAPCEAGDRTVWLKLRIEDTFTAPWEGGKEILLPDGYDEWVIFEVAVSLSSMKAEVVVKDISGNVIDQLTKPLDPSIWTRRPLDWFIGGGVYESANTSVEFGAEVDIMRWEWEEYYG